MVVSSKCAEPRPCSHVRWKLSGELLVKSNVLSWRLNVDKDDTDVRLYGRLFKVHGVNFLIDCLH